MKAEPKHISTEAAAAGPPLSGFTPTYFPLTLSNEQAGSPLKSASAAL